MRLLQHNNFLVTSCSRVMKIFPLICLFLPASICSKFSRLIGPWDVDEVYKLDDVKSESPSEFNDDFEIKDDWKKDLALLEERLTRLEEQFKEKIAFDTRQERLKDEIGEWKRKREGSKDNVHEERLPYMWQDFTSKPTPVYITDSLRTFSRHSQNFDNRFHEPSRDIPKKYFPRDFTSTFKSSDHAFNQRSTNHQRGLQSRDSDYNAEDDVPYIARPKIHRPEPIVVGSPSGIPPNKDCDSIYDRGMSWNGVYDILLGGRRVEVYCLFEQSGHNWMIIQRRIDGDLDFYRNWENYKRGFGIPSGEFWIGLENLHQLTSSNAYVLRIELMDWEGNSAYAEYRTFNVGDETGNYRLSVSGYSGDAGDALAYHNGRPFSTRDRNHDALRSINCAEESHGGWWYNACQRSNLNGRYLQDGKTGRDGISWYYWKSSQYSMKEVTMKIRRA